MVESSKNVPLGIQRRPFFSLFSCACVSLKLIPYRSEIHFLSPILNARIRLYGRRFISLSIHRTSYPRRLCIVPSTRKKMNEPPENMLR